MADEMMKWAQKETRKNGEQVCITSAHDWKTKSNGAYTLDKFLKNMPKWWSVETGNGRKNPALHAKEDWSNSNVPGTPFHERSNAFELS